MKDRSRMCEAMSLPDTPAATSSRESEFGTTHSGLQDGPPTGPCGPEAAPALPSPRPAAEKRKTTRGTFGQTGLFASKHEILSVSLASRYRQLTASLGSTMYSISWMTRVTPSGFSIPAQRGLGRRTSVSVSTGADCELMGWPTPMVQDENQSRNLSPEAAAREINRKGGSTILATAVTLVGWPTPSANQFECDETKMMERRERCKESTGNGNGFGLTTAQAVMLAGWSTPRAEDAESAGTRHSRGVADTLTAQAVLTGWATPQARDHFPAHLDEYVEAKKAEGHGMANLNDQASLAATGPGPIGFLLGLNGWETCPASGQLNPAHSRWLMGLPPAWDACGVTAMPSSRRKRRRSSNA